MTQNARSPNELERERELRSGSTVSIAYSRGEIAREIEDRNEMVYRLLRQRAEIFRPRDGTRWADFTLHPEPDALHTWSSSSGEKYQTYDPGANPNGVLAGHWTEETKPAITKPQ